MRRWVVGFLTFIAFLTVFTQGPASASAAPLCTDISTKLGIEYRDCGLEKSESISTPYARAMTEEVWDTYLSLTGVLNGQPVQGKIIKVFYKRLTFNKSYTQLPSTLVSVEAIMDNNHYMEGIGMVYGSIETWRCNYSIR